MAYRVPFRELTEPELKCHRDEIQFLCSGFGQIIWMKLPLFNNEIKFGIRTTFREPNLSPWVLRYSAFSMSVSAQYYLRKSSIAGDIAPLIGQGLHQCRARQVSQSLHHRPG